MLHYIEDHVGFELRDYWDDLAAPERKDSPDSRAPWYAWEIDGAVAILPHGQVGLEWAKSWRVPVVSIGSEFRDHLPTVHVSAASVADLAVEHLLSTGYPNLAFIGVEGFVSVDNRRLALEGQLKQMGRSLMSYGLHLNPWPGHFLLEENAARESGLEQFLLEAPKPLGILAASDHVRPNRLRRLPEFRNLRSAGSRRAWRR